MTREDAPDNGAPGEPRWLSEPILLAVHARQVERYGGAHGVLDENVVRAALARPRHGWSYDEDADVADLAATYLVGFSRSQGFRDGNKRTALAASLVFLSLNSHALHVPPQELYAVCMKAALGEADDEEVARYLGDRIEPAEGGARGGGCSAARPHSVRRRALRRWRGRRCVIQYKVLRMAKSASAPSRSCTGSARP